MVESDWEDVPHSEDDWVDVEPPKEMGAVEGLTRSTLKTLPVVGGALGGLAGTGVAPGPGTLVGAGLGTMAGKSLQNGIEGYLYDDERQKQNYQQIFKDQAMAGLEGVTGEMGGQIISKGAQMAAPYAAKGLSAVTNKFSNAAEKLAENATGATGTQVAKFRDGAGRELLDRGLVKALDTPEKIAQRTTQEMAKANSILDDSLKALDEKGAVVNVENVVSHLDKKIAALEKNPSQARVVDQLKKIKDDIIHSVDITETGSPEIPVSLAEQTKRGYNQQSKLNWGDSSQNQAQKEAYRSYMGEVEDAAMSVDPAIAEQFMEAKKVHGLLKPINEAAQKRANTLNQSPVGGLLDATSVGVGMMSGDPISFGKGVATAVGRRIAAPRVTSTLAVGADKLSQLMKASPAIADMITNNPALAQTIVNRISQGMKPEQAIIPPPPPTPQQIKADPKLAPHEKAKALMQMQEQQKMMQAQPIVPGQ